MENWTPWVPQDNGTYLPSEELIKAVREDRSRFPHFVDDTAALGGLTPEQVEDVIKNPVRAGGQFDNGILGAGNRLTGAAIKGLGEAAGWAMDKLVPGEHGDTIREATGFGPAFETERGIGEKVAEVVGQAAPAAVGAMAAHGWATATAVGTGLTTLSFDDQDTTGCVVDKLAGGDLMPDLVLLDEDEDDPDTRAMKHMAVNLISDGLFGAVGAAGSKLYRIFKETQSGLPDMHALKALSDEAGIPLRDSLHEIKQA